MPYGTTMFAQCSSQPYFGDHPSAKAPTQTWYEPAYGGDQESEKLSVWPGLML